MLFVNHEHGITTIDTGYLRRGMAASHLLVEQRHAVFIDSGTTHSLDNLLQALKIRGVRQENVDFVVTTHVHLDHAGGAGRLLQELPNARLVVHPRGAPHMADPSKLMAGASEVYGAERMEELYATVVPVPPERIVEAPDGFSFELQGRTLRCIDTPGHARHHLCLVDARSRSVFTGDAFGLSYREFDTANGAFIFPTTTPVQFEPEAMHASIDRIMAENPAQVYLTHYGEVRNPRKLARELHYLIDSFVTIAKDLGNKGKHRRHLILETMAKLLFEALKEHGYTLGEQDCRRIIAHDLELNALGLEIWWDKKNRT